MKSLPLLFLGVFLTLALSWTGIVLTSYIQLGDLEPATTTLIDAEGNPISGVVYPESLTERPTVGENQPNEEVFPKAMVGAATRGQQVYAEMGCLYCHSQQVRRKGFGSDFERGWGERQSVARDYVFHQRVMLGTMRTGPDLANVGTRYSETWQHQHLYDPQSVNDWSIMPRFEFLYTVQKISDARGPSDNAVTPLPSWNIPEGYEVVPSSRAEDLVAYLMSLTQHYELPEAKFSQ